VAVAHRLYARAFFQAAREEGRLDVAHEQLGDFVAALTAVPELRSTLANPELDAREKSSIVEQILGGADELVRNFLLLLAEKGRIGQLEEIGREFDALVAAEEGRLDVELTTAVELSDEEADRLARQIEQASGRTVVATRKVDPSLIGGLILQAGSLRVDASVRGRLDRLRHQLRTRR
jgi:F-type H+-transporting ATPase subunit delta